ncbi:MAG: hypothetical protein PHH54_07200 [Candidatus Nanoarchaeia archaeon]|nr:hypothetical protein [Candidatus Nanoarchaeia archaeon]MDD5741742.1 hypothetical protein [Candidatus Nanoarchaeia archaeon]
MKKKSVKIIIIVLILVIALFAVSSYLFPNFFASLSLGKVSNLGGELTSLSSSSLNGYDCMNSSHPDYANWVYWGKPDCWCYKYQCRGDADGLKTLSYWVSASDLSILKSVFLKAESIVRDTPNGICADFNHKKILNAWVDGQDLSIFKQSYVKTNITPCNSSYINYWIDPSCHDTCASNGYNCGTWNICGVSTNCGTCGGGFYCNATAQCAHNNTCYDSDGGRIYNVKGNISGYHDGTYYIAVDYCWNDWHNITLTEYSCLSSNQYSQNINCTGNYTSCSNGACIV